MSIDVLNEEFEVLESIYSDEFRRSAERHVQLTVGNERDETDVLKEDVVLQLDIEYPESYPESVPHFSLDPIKGILDIQELNQLLESIQALAERNLGEPLTFTVVSHLREELIEILSSRVKRRIENAKKVEQQALQAESQRLKGTKVTPTSFGTWRNKFAQEMKSLKEKEQDSRVKLLSNKEREEVKKITTRLSGRQLFEKNRNLDESDALLEEGTDIDFSSYNSSVRRDDETELLTFVESD